MEIYCPALVVSLGYPCGRHCYIGLGSVSLAGRLLEVVRIEQKVNRNHTVPVDTWRYLL